MLNIGVIGAGRIGKIHAESIQKYVSNACVYAVADPFIDTSREWAEKLGIKNIYKDYKEILIDPKVDAVVIASSTDTHSKISVEAINAGKHIFCEKPIDHDVDKIKKVISALEGKNIKYQVGFNRRFDKEFAAVKQAITEGKIGNLHMLKITSRDPEAPPVSYIKVSGGIFLDMTIHDFDMVRYLSGSDVTEVYATGGALINSEIAKAGDIDTALISLKLSNGAFAVIDNSREAKYGYDQRAEAFGSLGMAQSFNVNSSSLVISSGSGIVSNKPLYFFLERYKQAYIEEMQQFVSAVENDTKTPVNVMDGLAPVLIGLGCKLSLERNAPVKISEIKEKYKLK